MNSGNSEKSGNSGYDLSIIRRSVRGSKWSPKQNDVDFDFDITGIITWKTNICPQLAVGKISALSKKLP